MRTISSVLGNSQRLDGGAMFGNVPKALWSRWLAPDERNRLRFSCRALLIEDENRKILLETGIGAFFDAKLRDRFGVEEAQHVLLAELNQLGVAPAELDIVVLSHLHFDHAGGLLSAHRPGLEPTLVFPNALFVVGKTAWKRANEPHFRDRASFIPALQPLLEKSGRLRLVEGDRSDVLGDGFRFRHSEGHTPGMMLTEVEMPDGPVLFAADLIPGRPWVHLPITMGYDRFPERLIDEKRELLESLVQRQGRLFYTHDFECAMSHVACEEGRYLPTAPRESFVRLAR